MSALALSSNTRTHARPAAFASYIAMSALRRITSADSFACSAKAMPMLAVTRSSRPAISKGTAARSQHVLGDHLRSSQVDPLAHDDEFVAAEPGDRIGRPHRPHQPAGHRYQQRVTDAVAEAVVHDLEMVDVDEEHRQGAAASDRVLDGAAHDLQELRSIRQLGETVVCRFVRQRVLERSPFGDVAAVEHDATDVRIVHQVRRPHFEPALRAIGPQQHEARQGS